MSMGITSSGKGTLEQRIVQLEQTIADMRRQLNQIPSRFPVGARAQDASAFRGYYANAYTLPGVNAIEYQIDSWDSSPFFGSLGSHATGSGGFNVPVAGIYRAVFRTTIALAPVTVNLTYIARFFASLKKNNAAFDEPAIAEAHINQEYSNLTPQPGRSVTIEIERTESFAQGDVIAPYVAARLDLNNSFDVAPDYYLYTDLFISFFYSTMEVHRLDV